jgi:hypothetical protein
VTENNQNIIGEPKLDEQKPIWSYFLKQNKRNKKTFIICCICQNIRTIICFFIIFWIKVYLSLTDVPPLVEVILLTTIFKSTWSSIQIRSKEWANFKPSKISKILLYKCYTFISTSKNQKVIMNIWNIWSCSSSRINISEWIYSTIFFLL